MVIDTTKPFKKVKIDCAFASKFRVFGRRLKKRWSNRWLHKLVLIRAGGTIWVICIHKAHVTGSFRIGEFVEYDFYVNIKAKCKFDENIRDLFSFKAIFLSTEFVKRFMNLDRFAYENGWTWFYRYSYTLYNKRIKIRQNKIFHSHT